MRDLRQGRPFHGEFSSADASALNEANSRFTLYDAGATPSAITLAANERVVITDIQINYSGATARTVSLYDGPDTTIDAGETIVAFNAAQYGNLTSNLETPHYCQKGDTNGYPKLKASGAGQVDAIIRGVIEKL